ncbi:MAG: ABC transporter permease subunit [Candidatus Margulisiibacteriota bacterium]
MKLSYYAKNRLVHYFIHVIMVFLLVLTLFPIGWMVYSSMKENTDILAGRVALSRAKNGILAIGFDDHNYYACTSDGGINKFTKVDNLAAGYCSTRTMVTNFLFDSEVIWVSSANEGLIRVNKSDLSTKKFKLPLKELDISKIAKTILLKDGNKIWYSVRYKGYEGMLEFDTQLGQVMKSFDLISELSPIQILSLEKAGDVLWVGVDKGLLAFDTTQGKVVKAYPLQEAMPVGIDLLKNYSDGQLLLGSSTGLAVFNPRAGKITGWINSTKGLLSDQIESIVVDGNLVYIGTNLGLSVYDIKKSRATSFSDLFVPLSGENTLAQGKALVGGLVAAIATDRNYLYLGSSSGRISVFDLSKSQVTGTAFSKSGHLIIAWRNYIDLWKNINFGLYLRNSFIICGLATIIAMILATLSAYAISRFDFPGNKLFSVSILASQMIPGIMFLIPIYIMFVKFTEWTGVPLKGTFFGMVFIYSAFFVPFSIWILRGFFAAIPKELEEAARIDGCSPLQVFWYVVLPLAVPGIIATGIYLFLNAWDELVFAWILTSGDTMTIPVGIRLFVGNYQNRFDLMMAAATVATLPVMILFFMLQKYIVKGLTAGAVKG